MAGVSDWFNDFWERPQDPPEQIAAPRPDTFAGKGQPEPSSLPVMSGGAEPAGAAKQHA